jgi:hypothetical protein
MNESKESPQFSKSYRVLLHKTPGVLSLVENNRLAQLLPSIQHATAVSNLGIILLAN